MLPETAIFPQYLKQSKLPEIQKQMLEQTLQMPQPTSATHAGMGKSLSMQGRLAEIL